MLCELVVDTEIAGECHSHKRWCKELRECVGRTHIGYEGHMRWRHRYEFCQVQLPNNLS